MDSDPLVLLQTQPRVFWALDQTVLEAAFATHHKELARYCIGSLEHMTMLHQRRIFAIDIVSCRLLYCYGIDTDPAYTGRPQTASERMMERLTRWRTGDITHCELGFCIVARDTGAQLYHRFCVSVPRGVTCTVYRSFDEFGKHRDRFRCRLLDACGPTLLRMYLFCMLQDGKKFDKLGFWLGHAPLLHRLLPQTTLDNPCWTCSEFVCTALQLSKEDYRRELDAKRCAPNDIVRCVLRYDNQLIPSSFVDPPAAGGGGDQMPLLGDLEL
jgi:hypothetical protein